MGDKIQKVGLAKRHKLSSRIFEPAVDRGQVKGIGADCQDRQTTGMNGF
jgi:hypothetical protein